MSNSGDLIGYARVSTGAQTADLQVDAMRQIGASRIFTETASGSRSDRPELVRLFDHLRPGDTLVVWRLDRLGRSLRDLVVLVNELDAKHVNFRSLQESIDTSTPSGRLIFHVFASLAEFERELLRERTAAGLLAARARGRHGGRPTVMTAKKLDVAKSMFAETDDDGKQIHTVSAIAETIGVSRATIYRALRRELHAMQEPAGKQRR